MKNNVPQIIKGGSFSDERGIVGFVNNFSFNRIKRFYTIEHTQIKTVRAWQGHKKEQKYFYALDGEWIMNLIKIDDWKNPSTDLEPIIYKISKESDSILKVPAGYATGFLNSSDKAKILIFSDMSLSDSIGDDYRYEKDYFLSVNWEE